jgi:hypothetical protein
MFDVSQTHTELSPTDLEVGAVKNVPPALTNMPADV